VSRVAASSPLAGRVAAGDLLLRVDGASAARGDRASLLALLGGAERAHAQRLVFRRRTPGLSSSAAAAAVGGAVVDLPPPYEPEELGASSAGADDGPAQNMKADATPPLGAAGQDAPIDEGLDWGGQFDTADFSDGARRGQRSDRREWGRRECCGLECYYTSDSCLAGCCADCFYSGGPAPDVDAPRPCDCCYCRPAACEDACEAGCGAPSGEAVADALCDCCKRCDSCCFEASNEVEDLFGRQHCGCEPSCFDCAQCDGCSCPDAGVCGDACQCACDAAGNCCQCCSACAEKLGEGGCECCGCCPDCCN
jgi:hypothetical protein